ncbi:MAG: sugar transferase [Flavobacteriaceae bacterium]|nr:sugar transferase [Flavobacteriaceae bacterium]
MKRLFDVVCALLGLIVLGPFLLLIALAIKIVDKGPIIYKQLRVGQFNTDFHIYKFKTMQKESEKLGLLTIGNNDLRITKLGYYLRKYKLDELPQLFNVLKGNMSLVGPRPELRHYVNFYNDEQLQVLNYKPGITSLASIKYRNECEILSLQKDPEAYFINEIIPIKARINLAYHKQRSFLKDIKIILKTVFKTNLL